VQWQNRKTTELLNCAPSSYIILFGRGASIGAVETSVIDFYIYFYKEADWLSAEIHLRQQGRDMPR